jgi:hypothetical protein
MALPSGGGDFSPTQPPVTEILWTPGWPTDRILDLKTAA